MRTSFLVPTCALLVLGPLGCPGPEPTSPPETVADSGTVTDAGQNPSDGGVPDSGAPPATDASTPLGDGGVTVHLSPDVTSEQVPVTQSGADGLTPELTVDVDGNVESIMIVGLAADSNTSLQVLALKNPAGEVLAQGQDHFEHKSRSVAAFGAHATLVPESGDFQSLFTPGTYRFKVMAARATSPLQSPAPSPDSPVRALVLKKAKPQPQDRHVLDVNLFFTGAAGVNATAARTNSRVVTAVKQLKELYATANVDIGEVRYFDTPPGYEDVADLIPAQPKPGKKNFPELMRLSAGAPPGLNFFFVESLDPLGFGAFLPVLGVSGGIPGPTALAGTDRSGVIVLFDVATWTPRNVGGQVINDDFLGTVMAHEGGHFLGLSHTYEALLQGKGDNLSDTPKQSEPGANDYLMQPSATSNRGKLSPLQGLTMRRNPVVRTVRQQ